MSKFITRLLISVIGISAFCLSASSEAKADTVNSCTVSIIGLDFGGLGPRLKVLCDGKWYYTNPSSPCPSATMDQVKLWESMAMTAMLSGKKINISYPTLGTCADRTIQNIDVVK